MTTLTGDKELLSTFGRFMGPRMGRAKRRAVQAGAKVIEKQIKKNFGKLSTTIPRAIGTVIRVYQDGNLALGISGIEEIGGDPEARLKKRLRARGRARSTDLSPFAQKALLLEFGADPHIIEADGPHNDPRNVLMDWNFGIAKVFGFKVRHPGTRPKAPMKRAFNSKVSAAQEAQKRELAMEIDRIAREGQNVLFGPAGIEIFQDF